ncbi:MAG: hypothetical protein JRI47_02605 [Deltaproteobacteria bacterium]|nr:hypothetical protein [Deltaproteobacteria bacterium]
MKMVGDDEFRIGLLCRGHSKPRTKVSDKHSPFFFMGQESQLAIRIDAPCFGFPHVVKQSRPFEQCFSLVPSKIGTDCLHMDRPQTFELIQQRFHFLIGAQGMVKNTISVFI